MANKHYRPSWPISKWLLISKHLKNSLLHSSKEWTEDEIRFIADIISELEGKEVVENLVVAIMSKDKLSNDSWQAILDRASKVQNDEL